MFPPILLHSLPAQSNPPAIKIPGSWKDSPLKNYTHSPSYSSVLLIEGLQVINSNLNDNSVYIDPLPKTSKNTRKSRTGLVWALNGQKYYAITDLLGAVGFASTDRGEINGILVYSQNKIGFPVILSNNAASSYKSTWVVTNSKFNIEINDNGQWKVICSGEISTGTKRWLKIKDTRGIVYAALILGEGIPRIIDDKYPNIERTGPFADIDIYRSFYNMIGLYVTDPFYGYGLALRENACP